MKIQHFCRALFVALGLFAVSAASHAEWNVGVSVGFAPPALPVYDQPPIPAPGYLWTPGYWAYSADDEDYFWVPGTWVLAPRPGYLWTPGYWAADGAYFAWRSGYWGPEVGFYGGINYGFGYFGIGFGGGYWRGNDFCYNRAVTNVNNVSITNIYNNTSIVNNRVSGSRVSYNGGQSGIRLRPSAPDRAVAHAPHFPATNEQLRHESAARSIPLLRASANHGQPPIAATPKPASFSDLGRGAGSSRDVAAGRDRPHAPSERAGFGRNGAPVGTRTYRAASPAASPAASSNGRSSAWQPRATSNPPRAARPAWSDRGSAQDRTSPSSGYRPNPRVDYSAARAPIQRWTPPTKAAPDYRYAHSPSPHPVPPQQAAAPTRQYGRTPPNSVPHPPANTGLPRTYTAAPHGNGEGTRHGANHS